MSKVIMSLSEQDKLVLRKAYDSISLAPLDLDGPVSDREIKNMRIAWTANSFDECVGAWSKYQAKCVKVIAIDGCSVLIMQSALIGNEYLNIAIVDIGGGRACLAQRGIVPRCSH